MSAITNLIPKIEGFQPIPNAVMIPFMEAQSAALAYGFGLNYEYGKRKIRSMSNDEFNSLTSEQISELSNEHTSIILQGFINAVPKVLPMQTEIFKQYVEIEKRKVLQNVELAKWTLANAPSILLGGVASDTSGSLNEDTTTGSPTGTSISQDAEGNVITTHAGTPISQGPTEGPQQPNQPPPAKVWTWQSQFTHRYQSHFSPIKYTTVTKPLLEWRVTGAAWLALAEKQAKATTQNQNAKQLTAYYTKLVFTLKQDIKNQTGTYWF